MVLVPGATKLTSCANYITFEDILRSIIAIVSPDGSAALRVVISTPQTQVSPVACTTLLDFLTLLQDSIVIDSDGCPSLNVTYMNPVICGGNCVTASTIPEILSSVFVTDGTNTFVQIGYISNLA